jgi:uncharacterized membrane protein YeaQ/YmgE (transglycosylase-associated protein family)
MLILAILVLGLSAGWAARSLLGRDLDWGATLALGLGGSLVGGLVASLIAGDGLDLRLSGLLGSIAGAIMLLLIGDALFGRRSSGTSTRRAR